MPESWEYTLHIPHDPRAVTVCRRTLRLILALHRLTHLADTAELLTSELVSNAVLHTKARPPSGSGTGKGCSRSAPGTPTPNLPEPPGKFGELTDARTAAASPSCGPTRTCGVGSRSPGWAVAASWSGAN